MALNYSGCIIQLRRAYLLLTQAFYSHTQELCKIENEEIFQCNSFQLSSAPSLWHTPLIARTFVSNGDVWTVSCFIDCINMNVNVIFEWWNQKGHLSNKMTCNTLQH